MSLVSYQAKLPLGSRGKLLHPLEKTMPRTTSHWFRQQKPKQVFCYLAEDENGNKMKAGQSRRWDCKTVDDIHSNGDLTPVIRYPLGDEIVTEHGFMTRESYLQIAYGL